MAQTVDDGEEDADVGGVARPHLRADRPALGIDHHADDHLHQIGPVVLRVAALAEGLAADAGEAQRGGVHEDDGEFGEEVAPPLEQSLLDLVLDRARGEGRGAGLLVSGEFLAEPGHGAVEVVQGKAVNAGDVVVGQPLLAGAVRAGDHDPVQHGGEDRPLDRELEATPGQQVLDDGLAAGLLPQPSEQPRRADAPAGELAGIAPLELRQHDGAFGIAGNRAGQALEPAGGDHDLLAAEIPDDALLGAAVLADGFDQVEVSVAVDGLFPDEHAGLAAEVGAFRQSKSA